MSQIDFFALTEFDLAIISFILISVLFGLFKGLIKSFISFAGWIISFVLAIEFSEIFVPIFEKYTSSSDMAIVVSTGVLFLISSVIIAIVNSIIVAIVSVISGGLIDRSLGLFFGFARGCFLVSLLFYFMIMMWPSLDVRDKSDVYEDNHKLPKWAKNSESLLLLARGSGFISVYMPEKLEKTLQNSLEESKSRTHGSEGFFFKGKSSDIKVANQILNTLPQELLEGVDQKDILTLQDRDSSYKEKVIVLEEIADKYQRYQAHKVYYDATKREIDRHNKRYYKIMNMLEDEIRRYNRLIEEGKE